jgi:hypothetical protein
MGQAKKEAAVHGTPSHCDSPLEGLACRRHFEWNKVYINFFTFDFNDLPTNQLKPKNKS